MMKISSLPSLYWLRKKLSFFFKILTIVSIFCAIWLASQRYAALSIAGKGIMPPPSGEFISLLEEIIVGTYNIRRAKGVDGITDLSRTAKIVSNADIVALNEVSGNMALFPTWYGSNQAQQLANLTESGHLFSPAQNRWLRPYFGNGFLSKLKVDEWYSILLPAQNYNYNLGGSHNQPPSYKTHRILSVYKIPIAANEELAILVTHLTREEKVQPQQLRYVISELSRYPKAILLGDLNTSKSNPQIADLLSDPRYVDAIEHALKNSDYRNKIDWIISTSNLKIIDGSVIPAGVSDHPYFWVKFKI